MTLQQIDEALNGWHERLAVISQNLLELEQQPTYRLLTGHAGSGKAPICGVTAARVEPAVAAMVNLFQHFGELNATIESATRLRTELPALFGGEQKLRELQHLLFDRSIRLPARDVPLAQRTLLSSAENRECVSPSELVEAMSRSFAEARDAVLAVDRAWQDLLTVTDAAATELESTASPSAEARRLLEQIQEKGKLDPLGAAADLRQQVQPLLDEARRSRELSRSLSRTLAQAQVELEALMQTHAEAVAVTAEARARIEAGQAIPAPSPGETLDGLRIWLERLQRKAAEGALHAVEVGLRNWQTAADECLTHEQAALGAGRRALQERDELRGRLQALKAKARVYGVCEVKSFADLSSRAEAMLYAHPANLQRAAALVAEYEDDLRVATRARET
jgi:hypothetical protein